MDLRTHLAFRVAFLGRPEVRICTRPAAPANPRFVQDDTERVFLWTDDVTNRFGATFEVPVEAPRVASAHGPAYDDTEHWAEVTRAWWDGEPVGVYDGRAVVWE